MPYGTTNCFLHSRFVCFDVVCFSIYGHKDCSIIDYAQQTLYLSGFKYVSHLSYAKLQQKIIRRWIISANQLFFL